jgi:NAD(P)-dependent dehydrogenase (short-subunit alcohol dehydrogenase family)
MTIVKFIYINITAIEKTTGYLKTTLWLVDLNEFSSVVAFADKFEDVALDIVVANAGVSCESYQVSPEGWEHTYGSKIFKLAIPDLGTKAPSESFVNDVVVYTSPT